MEVSQLPFFNSEPIRPEEKGTIIFPLANDDEKASARGS